METRLKSENRVYEENKGIKVFKKMNENGNLEYRQYSEIREAKRKWGKHWII